MTKKQRVVIVGGVAGGASAAARLRRLDEHAEIIMLEKGEHISFANCGLPYHIGGTIQDRGKLLVQTPEAMRQRFGIDVRTESEATAINTAKSEVTVRQADGSTYILSYDSLVLSPGAKPRRPAIEGLHNCRSVYSLRSLRDMDRIMSHMELNPTQHAVVIGGGFIGVETAENLRERGLDVTIVQSGPHILAPFDSEMAVLLEQELEHRGVALALNASVTRMREASSGETVVTLNDGTELRAGIILMATGVKPDTGFLAGSGINVGADGHIIVDHQMRTSAANVYAVGDAVMTTHRISGQRTAIPLAGPANKQGRIVADVIAGLKTTYKGTQGTSIVKVFELTGASTGLNARELNKLGIPFHAVHLHPQPHASYYPGGSPMSLKLLFRQDGRVLGAQAVGYGGVDKRIDVIATIIRLGGTVSDLTELELAYAPPYSSAKDPVNMAGYMAENILTGMTDVYHTDNLPERDPATTMLIDVRTPLEFGNVSIPGAVNIPVDELRDRLGELDASKTIWVFCQVGLRGYTASRILAQRGFHVRNLSGGYRTYKATMFKPQKPGQQRADSDAANPNGSVSQTTITPSSKSNAEEKGAVISMVNGTPAAKTAGTNTIEKLDACGLCCPGPLIQVKERIDRLTDGSTLEVSATDPGFYEDIRAWCEMTGNELVNIQKEAGTIRASIRKGLASAGAAAEVAVAQSTASGLPAAAAPPKDGATFIVFDGSLDKAIASFILANGAAAAGKPVTMFFTFWGLNMLRKSSPPSVQKSVVERMFGWMMPRGSKKLPLSTMQMMGIGPKMIRAVMKSKNIASLEELMESAKRQGVEIVACQMSMDVMGIKREELIDGITVGGVGYYLGQANKAGTNLFI
ncbi:NADPH-dependent 2,4-dienoyl-CoA reductase/sulfur reductase-like enzyme [Paenibacillus cellulosilyticus]|uniref:NADPH-dependent 2,4-dienoyl-CoA reductase/sulfur reductase-like enzyme n=1 Tax=Paenibacillus cellulosilyticus TaxID=375489 RepID=A0A2V2YRW1_9BACL|nr:DsrE/DsrF/DrsH-like family protein [Paenibacillus cellulosilyticus]PWW00884.1 NADPH-dependent 2,4-dienoyl-CoA reductase/sulfur reductase-like enzyme [Paenibacillus cellulosilyticus]QKS47543.1 DsrE/DsrF/DrsH-like family protein [Paenibacillus cellulosilyticus]